MEIFEANISHQSCSFLNECLKNVTSIKIANRKLFDACGIHAFFDNINDYQLLIESIQISNVNLVAEPDRAEYGNFQTNTDLANHVAQKLGLRQISPEIVIEPTCGKCNFIIASLSNFKNIKRVFGIEIYKPYVWETKFNILDFFLSNPNNNKPEITITHSSVFDFDFKLISKQFPSYKLLIIGNPPWVQIQN